MILAVDIGNARICCTVFRGKRIVLRFDGRTPSFTNAMLAARFFRGGVAGIGGGRIEGVCVASVVPTKNRIIERASENAFLKKPLFITPDDVGIPIVGYDKKQIGVDRLVNALAAYERYGKALIVIDAGSCITFDAISDGGEYLGGAIVPGINLSLRSLHERTAKLPEVEFARPKRAIGKNTKESIRSGIYHGYAGLIEGQIRAISKELKRKPIIIATGGDARIISKLSSMIEAVHPDLIFEGIRLVWMRNRNL